MKAQHSIGMPTRCEISTIGLMSASSVRAAQLGVIRRRWSTISRASRSTSATTCGPAPGSPMSAVSIPSSSIRCRSRSFCSMTGLRTDGDCSPSRSVSSSSMTDRAVASLVRFQS